MSYCRRHDAPDERLEHIGSGAGVELLLFVVERLGEGSALDGTLAEYARLQRQRTLQQRRRACACQCAHAVIEYVMRRVKSACTVLYVSESLNDGLQYTDK